MNWVSSSLELAGSLLESVDQQAALTLAGSEEKEQKSELLTSRLHERTTIATVESKERKDDLIKETPKLTDGSSSSKSSQFNNTRAIHSTSTPPRANSEHKLADLVSSISTQLEHVSSKRGGKVSPGSSSSQSVLTGDDRVALKKELVQVNKELQVKEKKLSSMRKSMQICEEELLALEQECKGKIAQVQDEMSVIRMEKNVEKMKFIRALKVKDEQLHAMKANVDALTEANVQYTEEISALKAELVKAVELKDTLWTSAASASNESEQLIESLRSELQETLIAMKNLKREYAESKSIMFSRQVQLESTNTELVNNVANLERLVEKARETGAGASQPNPISKNTASGSTRFGVPPSVAPMTDDYRRVQQTLVLTKKSLQDESKKNEVQKQEIAALTEEVRRLKQAIKTAQENNLQKLEAASRENKSLKKRVDDMSPFGSAPAAADGELRIQRLTNKLIEKQETIDVLRNRVATMDVRLQNLTLQTQRAEDNLARMEHNGGVDDMEMAIVEKSGMRSRSNCMVHMIAHMAPIVNRSHCLVTALNVLDRWLLFLGRVFLKAPFARLGLLCYVLLIHCWVFIILSFHTSHLTDEIQISENVAEPGNLEETMG